MANLQLPASKMNTGKSKSCLPAREERERKRAVKKTVDTVSGTIQKGESYKEAELFCFFILLTDSDISFKDFCFQCLISAWTRIIAVFDLV